MSVKKLSRRVEDYENSGLNAEWSVSAYLIADNHIIFDMEMDIDETFSLCHVVWNEELEENIVKDFIQGTFEDCIDYYESNIRGIK